MSFFLTGGSGFVGLNLLEQLLGRGERVTTRARYPRFAFRLASRPEEGDARLAPGPRCAPLCARRLREETGFTARFDIDAAFDDYIAWREALGDAAP